VYLQNKKQREKVRDEAMAKKDVNSIRDKIKKIEALGLFASKYSALLRFCD